MLLADDCKIDIDIADAVFDLIASGALILAMLVALVALLIIKRR